MADDLPEFTQTIDPRPYERTVMLMVRDEDDDGNVHYVRADTDDLRAVLEALTPERRATLGIVTEQAATVAYERLESERDEAESALEAERAANAETTHQRDLAFADAGMADQQLADERAAHAETRTELSRVRAMSDDVAKSLHKIGATRGSIADRAETAASIYHSSLNDAAELERERDDYKQRALAAEKAADFYLAACGDVMRERDSLRAQLAETEQQRDAHAEHLLALAKESEVMVVHLAKATAVVEAARSWRKWQPGSDELDHPLSRLAAAVDALDSAAPAEVTPNEQHGIRCDFCGGPIPIGGEGHPEICPACIEKEQDNERPPSDVSAATVAAALLAVRDAWIASGVEPFTQTLWERAAAIREGKA